MWCCCCCCRCGEVHATARISQPDSLCALGGHKYHRLFIYSKRTYAHIIWCREWEREECCLFPIQLPSNAHTPHTAQHAFKRTRTFFLGWKSRRRRCRFPIVAGKIEMLAVDKYKYKQVAYSLCFNRIMDTAWARDTFAFPLSLSQSMLCPAPIHYAFIQSIRK